MANYKRQSNKQETPLLPFKKFTVGETDGEQVNDKIMPGGKLYVLGRK